MISKQISKITQTKDLQLYRLNCECGSPECNTELCFYLDEPYDTAFLMFEWEAKDLSFWNRLKILFTGRFEDWRSCYISSDEAITDLIEGLIEGRNQLRKYREKNEN